MDACLGSLRLGRITVNNCPLFRFRCPSPSGPQLVMVTSTVVYAVFAAATVAARAETMAIEVYILIAILILQKQKKVMGDEKKLGFY